MIEIARLLGAGVTKAWLGKAALPDDVPFCTGGIGLLGSKATDDAIREAAELAAQAAEPQSDHRGSEDYKRNVVRVFCERGLRIAISAAQAGEE